MFYSARNAKLKINNEPFVISDLEISYQAEIAPNYTIGKSFNTSYSAENGIAGSLRFTYYLTGADPIKPYLNNTGFISAELNGLTIHSGCLRSFSFSAIPNQPVQPSVEIVFFDKPSGTFAPTTVTRENIQVFNYSNITLDTLPNYSQEDISNLTQVNYAYTAEIEPFYSVSTGAGLLNLLPERVRFGPREIITEMVCDSLAPRLPISGSNLGLTITLKHPTLSTNVTYNCSGLLRSKTFSSSVGQPLKTNYTVVQNKVSSPPIITSYNNIVIQGAAPYHILGQNFDNLLSVYFGEKQAVVSGYTSTLIVTAIPEDGEPSAYITVNTINGRGISATPVSIGQIVSRVNNYVTLKRFTRTPAFSVPGQELVYDISGTSMTSVTQVRFGDVSAPFEVVSPTLVRARVPISGHTGPLVVVTSKGSQSGVPDTGVIFPPAITGFYPPSGVTGESITILGSNLGQVSKVRFNGVPASAFTIHNTGKITAIVPSGNYRGPIYVSGSGYSGTSLINFVPKIVVAGVVPPSGYKGSSVTIRGNNFIPEILTNVTGNTYRVYFNGIATAFTRVSDTLLSGLVPTGNITGPVFVADSSGALQKSASGFYSGYIIPELSGIVPQFVYSGKQTNLTIQGRYLYNPQTINFSGNGQNNIGQVFSVSTKLSGDLLGIKAFSTGYRFITPTGYYRVGLINYAGTGYLTGHSGEWNSGFYVAPAKNLALQGIATQSSNYTGLGTGTGLFYAYFAKDGITSGTSSNKFLAWTNSGTNPFWQVDMRSMYEVQEIKVYNRFDYALGANSPLTNFDLTLYSSDGVTSVYTTNYAGAEAAAYSFLVNPVKTGQFVKLVLNGSNKSLALAEVEVF